MFFKEIYVSIIYDPYGPVDGLTGIELSISGLPSALPPSDDWYPTQCDAPTYTQTSVTVGCYVLNPTGGCWVEGCQIRSWGPCGVVESKSWSGIKNLYR